MLKITYPPNTFYLDPEKEESQRQFMMDTVSL